MKIKVEQLFIIIIFLIGSYYIYLAFGTQMLGEDEAVYVALAKEFSNSNFPSSSVVSTGPAVYAVFTSLFFSSFFMIFGVSLSLAKALVAFMGFLTILLVYIIGKKFSIYYGFFAAVLLISLTGFSHESMLAYVEIPIALFSAFLTYLLLEFKVDQKDAIFKSVLIGSITALGFFVKASALVLVFVLFSYFIGLYYYTKNKNYLKFLLIYLVTFSVLVSGFIFRNLILYQFPYFEGLNIFFKPSYTTPTWLTDAVKQITPASISLSTYSSEFGWLALILSIFGASWLLVNWKTNLTETKFLIALFLPVVVFISIFNIFLITSSSAMDPRYLSIIFPQISLLGGFFLWKLKEFKKFLIFLILILLFAGSIFGILTAQTTSQSQRYPSDYLQALSWLKLNTPKDAFIFTAYSGSLLQYAERKNIWTIDEFPEIMHSQNGTYIYNTLKKYNVSYILIWSGILAQDYIIPQSNLLGAFTYNFYNIVSNDTEHFEVKFSNSDNVIFKLK
jgi:4-amino-4-deoxy-L-arabinose transferase-like glycosyltransferase